MFRSGCGTRVVLASLGGKVVAGVPHLHGRGLSQPGGSRAGKMPWHFTAGAVGEAVIYGQSG